MLNKKRNILIIEDNQGHAKLIIRLLKTHFDLNKIIHIDNGEDALTYLLKKGKIYNKEKTIVPDIILLDLRIPKIDGLELLKKIKTHKELLHIPVIVLSTSESEKDIKKAYNNYANSYLTKPIDFEEFSKLIYNFGNYWFNYSKNPV
jgi:two-component system, response regulator